MKMKKALTMVGALALVGALGIGSTLAYFTDKADAENVITMGHVDIEISEPKFDLATNKTKKITNIVPGDTIAKDPTITVKEGSEDAYIRAKLVFDAVEGSVALTSQQKTDILNNLNIDDTKWYLAADGYYYYKDAVTAGASVEMFDTLVIPSKWGNEAANLSFVLEVSAEAIQKDNFTPTQDTNGMVTGWVDENNNAISAENYVEP